MTADEFQIKLKRMPEQIKEAINNDLPVVMGVTAVDFFKENFQNEGFTDASNVPWQEVKRRQDPNVRGARATRKILTGDTGDLGESIEHQHTAPGETTIRSDKPYADAHNSGTTTAGRNHNVTIPQRQLIGESEQLDKLIEEEIESKLGNIFQ